MQITPEIQEDPDFQWALKQVEGIKDFGVHDFLKSYLCQLDESINGMFEAKALIQERIKIQIDKRDKMRGWIHGTD